MKGKTQLPIPAGAERVADFDLSDPQKYTSLFLYFKILIK